MSWVSEGIKSQPRASTILADTGAVIAAKTLNASVFTWATKTAYLELAQRDALNGSDVDAQRFDCQPGSERFDFNNIALGINERLVVRAQSDVDGDIQVSITF
jgi:hypothetical protein